ncbi:small GTP-binding protein domain [Edhazardia aedis USNM 41457]|uniref:Small GTP-binding protein domain n=1 Tax=Edhazardia aedis (strain USNM 41457) TaxID=1003232 RepID=J9D6X0_EDHAE|nr:small GTP-binding protein domain [Edhazardia aedis USNM 41457]|eukprot:EJW03269.1 small GTP-binding protein domain [Edhazardia aedis USNM 41457]
MSLTRMIKKIQKSNNEVKLLFLGLDNAGKTTILYRLFNKEISQIAPTFGYQIHNFEYAKDEKNIKLTILDVGGQQSFRKYWSNYFEKLDGLIFVYDSTDPRKFEDFLDSILEQIDDQRIPILILANKCDLAMNKKIKFKEFKENIKAFHVSAKTKENLYSAFDWILEKIVQCDIKI